MENLVVTQKNFDEVLSSASTSNAVNNVFNSLGGDIRIDPIFKLFKKWYDLVVVEEKSVKTLDDAINLCGSITNLFHCLYFFLPLDQYQPEGVEIMKTVNKIYQGLCISYQLPYHRLF